MGAPAIDLVAGTAEQMQQAQTILNGKRQIDEIPDMIKELSKKEQVAVVSVGPWAQTIKCGTLGTKFVPACQKGDEYSDPLVLDGLTIEMYPLREGRLDMLMHKESTGWNDGHQMIGVGRHLHPMNSKVKLGLFVTKGQPNFPPLSEKDAQNPDKKRWWLRERFKPLPAEIEKAKKALNGHLNNLVQEARSAAAQGQKAMEDTIRPNQHILAAQLLGLDPAAERWMQSATPEGARIPCPFCQVSIPVTATRCPNCKDIVDEERHAAAKANASKGKKN